MDGNQGQGSERGIVTTRNLVVEIGRFTRGGFVTADRLAVELEAFTDLDFPKLCYWKFRVE